MGMSLDQQRAIDAIKRKTEERHEAEAKAPKPDRSNWTADQIRNMESLENRTRSGAPERLPKEALLDASDVQAQHPDKHLRWVNIRDPQKALARQTEGFARLPSEEGGREIRGELSLMWIPKELKDAKDKEHDRITRERSKAPESEMRRAVESVVKEMKDNHGLDVDVNRMLVNE